MITINIRFRILLLQDGTFRADFEIFEYRGDKILVTSHTVNGPGLTTEEEAGWAIKSHVLKIIRILKEKHGQEVAVSYSD